MLGSIRGAAPVSVLVSAIDWYCPMNINLRRQTELIAIPERFGTFTKGMLRRRRRRRRFRSLVRKSAPAAHKVSWLKEKKEDGYKTVDTHSKYATMYLDNNSPFAALVCVTAATFDVFSLRDEELFFFLVSTLVLYKI